MCRMCILFALLFVEIIEGVSSKIIVNKCCDIGEYVSLRNSVINCVSTPLKLNFSSIKVFDDNLYETGKSVEDVFILRPGLFNYDVTFKNLSFDLTSLEDDNKYVTKNGLILEIPNVYNRFRLIKSDNYCVDHVTDDKGVLQTTPHIWAVYEGTDDEQGEAPRATAYVYATLVSCFFMLVVLAVYFMLPELQNLCGMILMAYVSCLFGAFLILVMIEFMVLTDDGCLLLTMGFYFFILASFCWMNVMSFDIWWTFRGYAKVRPIHRRGEGFKFCMYSLYAFGLSGLMTAFLAVMNTLDLKRWPWIVTPNVPKMGCFIADQRKMYYLYIPMLILIICNWIFYLMTAFNIWRLSRGTSVLDTAAAGTPQAHRSAKQRFMVYLKLSVLMGLNWLMEIISYLYPGKIWHISDIYNILIGFFIFLIFVCKKKIYKKLVKRYGCKRSALRQPSSKSFASCSSASDQETASLRSKVSSNPRGTNNMKMSKKFSFDAISE